MRYKSILLVLLIGLFLGASTNEVKASEQNQNFKDLVRFENEIHFLRDHNIVNGFSDTQFGPLAPIKRIDAVRMIIRELGVPLSDVQDPGFKDVSSSHPAYKEVAKAKELGIIDGIGYGLFNPDGKLTRAEMAKVMANAYSLKGDYAKTFEDVPNAYWAYDYISSLAHHKITVGYPDGTFHPTEEISRQGFSAFLARHLNEDFKPQQGQPTFTLETTNNSTVRLTFSEAVKNVESSNAIKGIKLGQHINGYDSITKVNDKIYDIHFPYPFYSSQLFVIDYDGQSSEKIRDLEGNVVKEEERFFQHEQDTTPPSLEGIEYENENAINVIFSEQILDKSVENPAGYTLFSDNLGFIDVTKATLSESRKTVTLETESLSGAKQLSLSVDQIRDFSREENLMRTDQITLDVSEKAKPKIVDFRVNTEDVLDAQLRNDSDVDLLFTEKMNKATITDLANYTFKTKQGYTISSEQVSLDVVAENQGISFNFSSAEKVIQGGSITIKDVEDSVGNVIETTKVKVPQENSKLLVEKTEINKLRDIKIYFNQLLGEVSPNQFAISIGGQAYKPIGVGKSQDKGKGILKMHIFDRVSEKKIANGEIKVQTVANADDDSSAQAPSSTTSVFNLKVDLKSRVIADASAPELMESYPLPVTTRDFNGNGKVDHIQLFFQEPMGADSVQLNQFEVEGYTIKDVLVGGQTTNYDKYEPYSEDQMIHISVAEKQQMDPLKEPKVNIRSGFTDLAGNEFEESEYMEAIDKTNPIITSVNGNPETNRITIMFSEYMSVESSSNAFKLSDGSSFDSSYTEMIYEEPYANPIGVSVKTLLPITAKEMKNVKLIVEPKTIQDPAENYIKSNTHTITVK